MRNLPTTPAAGGSWVRHSPALIAAGVAVLAASVVWPAVPVVTAMAVVALGATGATASRVRRSPALVPLLAVNLVVYGGLYAMFVGATLHTAAARPEAALHALAVADLAASIVPMGLVLATGGSYLTATPSAD